MNFLQGFFCRAFGITILQLNINRSSHIENYCFTFPESASPDSVINDTEVFVASSVVAGLPASSKKLGIYSEAQKQDGIFKQIRKFCSTSWPTKERTPLELKPY